MIADVLCQESVKKNEAGRLGSALPEPSLDPVENTLGRKALTPTQVQRPQFESDPCLKITAPACNLLCVDQPSLRIAGAIIARSDDACRQREAGGSCQCGIREPLQHQGELWAQVGVGELGSYLPKPVRP